MADGAKIVVDHASKLFLEGSVVAFRNVDLTVRSNEVLCIVGPSGCGKTTLPRCIGGLLAPSSGQVLIDGQAVDRPRAGVQSRPIHVHGIDFVSSEPHIFTDHIQAEEYEQVLQPGMVLVIEPNAVTADGMFGIFFGHTFIITDGEPECVDGYPWELTVIG